MASIKRFKVDDTVDDSKREKRWIVKVFKWYADMLISE